MCIILSPPSQNIDLYVMNYLTIRDPLIVHIYTVHFY